MKKLSILEKWWKALGGPLSGHHGHMGGIGGKGRPGGSRPRGSGNIPIIPNNWQKAYETYTEKMLKWDEVNWQYEGMSYEDYQKEATDLVKEMVEGREIAVRMPEEALVQMLDDGRMKTGFETGQSTASTLSTYMDTRASFEEQMFGISKDADVSKRPIYGYVMPGSDSSSYKAAYNYGGVVLHLKDDVRERSTVTVGDSMNEVAKGYGFSAKLVPTPLSSPDGRSFNIYSGQRSGTPASQRKSPELRRLGEYAEVQIFGGVKLADIAAISLPKDSGFDRGRLEKLGVQVREYSREDAVKFRPEYDL